jgi:pyrophosphatase PpaX
MKNGGRILPMPLKYILFDFDGTIADTNEIVTKCLQMAAVHGRGREFSTCEMDMLFGKPLHIQMEHVNPDRTEELVAFYRRNYMDYRDSMTHLFPGIYEMLQKLKDLGYRMGVVTNKNAPGIDHGFNLLDIRRFFDVAITSDDVINRKPHPEPVFKAFSMMRGEPAFAFTDIEKSMSDYENEIAEAVLIGDSSHDIECGKRAGCRTILVEWTSISIDTILHLEPDFVAKTPDDICEYIRSHR